MGKPATISAVHMNTVLAGASFLSVARAASVNHETIRQRYYAAGGAKRPMGRHPISEAKKADIISDIENGHPPKVVAGNRGVSVPTVFRVFRDAERGRCIDHRPSRKTPAAVDKPKNKGGRPPLDPEIKSAILAAVQRNEKRSVIAKRYGVSRVTVFRFVRDAQTAPQNFGSHASEASE